MTSLPIDGLESMSYGDRHLRVRCVFCLVPFNFQRPRADTREFRRLNKQDLRAVRKYNIVVIHLCAPGVVVDGYVSTNSSLPMAHTFQTSANEIAHEESCDRIFWVISATRCSCYTVYLGREWVIILVFPSVVYPSSNWGGYLRCSHGCRSSD